MLRSHSMGVDPMFLLRKSNVFPLDYVCCGACCRGRIFGLGPKGESSSLSVPKFLVLVLVLVLAALA